MQGGVQKVECKRRNAEGEVQEESAKVKCKRQSARGGVQRQNAKVECKGRQSATHVNTLVCLRPRADSERERACRRAKFYVRGFVGEAMGRKTRRRFRGQVVKGIWHTMD